MVFHNAKKWVILISICITLPLLGKGSSSTNSSTLPSKMDTQTTTSVAKMQKKIDKLHLEINRLKKMFYHLRKSIVSRREINRIAYKKAAYLVNKYWGKTKDSAKRIPLSVSTGGIKLLHMVVGRDRTTEPLYRGGTKIALAIRGPKYYGYANIVVYALPIKDLVARPQYLIFSDLAVPFFGGVAQTHFYWKGYFKNRKRAARGKYKIFAKVIVRNNKGKVKGSTSRFWGGKHAASSTQYTIKIK